MNKRRKQSSRRQGDRGNNDRQGQPIGVGQGSPTTNCWPSPTLHAPSLARLNFFSVFSFWGFRGRYLGFTLGFTLPNPIWENKVH